MEESQVPHVVILPSPGLGHLIPILEFAKFLLHHYHNFSITCITVPIGPLHTQYSILNALPKAIKTIMLPPIPSHEFPENAGVLTQICIALNHSIPSVRDILKNLASTTRLVAVVVDLFGMDVLDVALEIGVPPYLFYPSTCMSLSLALYLPMLDDMFSCEYRDAQEPLKLPGCVPFHGKDVLSPMSVRSNDDYEWLLNQSRRYKKAKGIIINSFVELEPETVKALKGVPSHPPIHPVGPIIRPGGSDGSECLRWLDEQPHGSVLFVCFGSGGTLCMEQMEELAWGLEMSGKRFLWVVKCPSEHVSNAAYFGEQNNKNPLAFLPNGFVERTNGLGLVVSSWAPQSDVLGHGSTGGFLSHCGWNSTLESMNNGVPMIAWPLYAEQKMNAVLLAEHLKVALRPTANSNDVISREEIARVINCLMYGEEGKRLRERMAELKEAGEKAWAEDGSSNRALSELVHEWSN